MNNKFQADNPNRLYAPIGLWVFVFIVFVMIGGDILGGRLPYLFTEKIIFIQTFIIFPSWLVLFIYFAYFHKWITSGRTSFRMRFTKEELANPYIKAKFFILTFMGGVVFSIFFAYISWSTIACAANFYSKNPTNKAYKIKNFRDTGNIGVNVGLIDITDNSEYLVNQKGYYLNLGVPWKVGDIVCAKGRTSALDTIIDDLKTGSCENY